MTVGSFGWMDLGRLALGSDASTLLGWGRAGNGAQVHPMSAVMIFDATSERASLRTVDDAEVNGAQTAPPCARPLRDPCPPLLWVRSARAGLVGRHVHLRCRATTPPRTKGP